MPNQQNTSLLPIEESRFEGRRPWQTDAWLPRHNLVCQLHAIGMKNKEIAAATGYAETKVSVIINDPRARVVIQRTLEHMASNISDLHTRLKVHATEALDEIVAELRESKDERIRQKAAFGILDRAGYTPVNKQLIIAGSMDERVASRMEKAMEKMEAIEAEYEVVEFEEQEDSEAASDRTAIEGHSIEGHSSDQAVDDAPDVEIEESGGG
jgi:hypothetical protein